MARLGDGPTPPSSRFVGCPLDPEARYARKFSPRPGSRLPRVHITEGCEEGLPNNNIATDVQQSAAGPVADGDATPLVHEALTREEPAAGERRGSWRRAARTPSSWPRARKSTGWTPKEPPVPTIQVASPPEERLRGRRLRHRLGQRGSDLPGRQEEPQLEDSRHRRAKPQGDEDKVLGQGDCTCPARAGICASARPRTTRGGPSPSGGPGGAPRGPTKGS